MLLALTDDFRSESGLSTLSKEFVIVFGNINFFLNGFKFLDCDIASLIETVSNLKWMETFI